MNSTQSKCASWKEYLLAKHGHMVSGPTLRKLLGFNDTDAFSRAIKADRCPVKTFRLEGRHAHFAWSEDVAAWLTQIGAPLP